MAGGRIALRIAGSVSRSVSTPRSNLDPRDDEPPPAPPSSSPLAASFERRADLASGSLDFLDERPLRFPLPPPLLLPSLSPARAAAARLCSKRLAGAPAPAARRRGGPARGGWRATPLASRTRPPPPPRSWPPPSRLRERP